MERDAFEQKGVAEKIVRPGCRQSIGKPAKRGDQAFFGVGLPVTSLRGVGGDERPKVGGPGASVAMVEEAPEGGDDAIGGFFGQAPREVDQVLVVHQEIVPVLRPLRHRKERSQREMVVSRLPACMVDQTSQGFLALQDTLQTIESPARGKEAKISLDLGDAERTEKTIEGSARIDRKILDSTTQNGNVAPSHGIPERPHGFLPPPGLGNGGRRPVDPVRRQGVGLRGVRISRDRYWGGAFAEMCASAAQKECGRGLWLDVTPPCNERAESGDSLGKGAFPASEDACRLGEMGGERDRRVAFPGIAPEGRAPSERSPGSKLVAQIGDIVERGSEILGAQKAGGNALPGGWGSLERPSTGSQRGQKIIGRRGFGQTFGRLAHVSSEAFMDTKDGALGHAKLRGHTEGLIEQGRALERRKRDEPGW